MTPAISAPGYRVWMVRDACGTRFSDDPEVNCAPLFVNALDGKSCPIQVLSKTVHRVRQMDSRSTHATWVLPCR